MSPADTPEPDSDPMPGPLTPEGDPPPNPPTPQPPEPIPEADLEEVEEQPS
ncbi:hypothetical protein [Methylobacterium sp. A54F]